MGGGDACVALVLVPWAPSPPVGRRKRPHPASTATPAPTGKRRFFLLNMTLMEGSEYDGDMAQ
jgi:hypothetical protein